MIYLPLRDSVVLHIITLGFISLGSNLQYQKQLYAYTYHSSLNAVL